MPSPAEILGTLGSAPAPPDTAAILGVLGSPGPTAGEGSAASAGGSGPAGAAPDFHGMIPKDLAQQILESTLHALPHAPGELAKMTAAGIQPETRGKFIAQWVSDIQKAKEGDQQAQHRNDARALIATSILGGPPGLTSTLPVAGRVAAGAALGAAQSVPLSLMQGEKPTAQSVGLNALFGAIPGYLPRAHEFAAVPRETALQGVYQDAAVKDVADALARAKPLRAEQTLIRRGQMASKVGLMRAAGEGLTGLERLRAERPTLAGAMHRVDFEPLNVDPESQARMFARLEDPNNGLRPLESKRAREALAAMLDPEKSVLPIRSDTKLLARALGVDFANLIESRRGELVPPPSTFTQRAGQAVQEAGSIFKGLRSTGDLSFSMRQAGFLMAGHPREFVRAFARQFPVFASQDAFDSQMRALNARSTAPFWYQMGLESPSFAGNLEERLGPGHLIRRLPRRLGGGIIRGSDRAYESMQANLRFDVADDMLRDAVRQGLDPEQVGPRIAEYVNTATGRGVLPGKLKDAGAALSEVFWAPRLAASRIQLSNPLYYLQGVLSGDPNVRFVRQNAIKDMFLMTGSIAGALGLAAYAGAKVEKNPLQADWGGFRIGDHFTDLTHGFASTIRPAARILAELYHRAATGETREGVIQPLGRYARGKESPIVAMAHDLYTGVDYNGNKITLPQEVKNLLLPLNFQDISQALQGGAVGPGLAQAVLATLGETTRVGPTPKPYLVGKGRKIGR